jgi:nucleoid-associated protein YgaU
MDTKPSREEDELQPEATGTDAITRDITGEVHVHPVEDSDPGTRIYVVRKGDTPGSIAQRFYGDSDQFRRILDANRDRIDDEDRLEVGSELRIPPA